jgi:hypothetical protein
MKKSGQKNDHTALGTPFIMGRLEMKGKRYII